ncbi:MAG: type IV pilus biogenesis/stability protein PilW [Betaproteobacteria bacterium]|nr:type IV pilus biogenesis/stability protein PilW [Betaproteobacteria bacterium]
MNARLAWLPLVLLLAGCTGLRTGDRVEDVNPEARVPKEVNQKARIHTELGAGYYSQGKYGFAMQNLNIAREADPNYPPAYNMLGLVHGELREDRQAEENFRRAIEISPRYSEGHNNYGLFLCKRKRVDEALKHFEAALANPLYETPERALANAGACALEKPDPAAAEMYFARALKRSPNHPIALLGMAEINVRNGRWLAARLQIRQLGDASVLSAPALWVGVRAERHMGDREAEAHYGAQLRRRFPEALQTQWLLTGQYDQVGGIL